MKKPAEISISRLFYLLQIVRFNFAFLKSSPLILVLPAMPPKKPSELQFSSSTSEVISAPQVPGSKTNTRFD